MKLENLSENLGMHSTGVDIDVASRLGPTINKHLIALSTLSKLLPNSTVLQTKLEELKQDFETSVSLHSNVLEKNAIDIVNLTLEQQLHAPVHQAVKDLEIELKQEGKRGKTSANGEISAKIKTVAERNNVTVNDLNKMFMASHGNTTPHDYVKMVKDGSVKESANKEMSLDDYIAASFVIETYETMKTGLGDKAWVAISKRLRAEGYEPSMVESMINRAIDKISKNK